MSDLLPPGNFPAPDAGDDPRQFPDFFASDMWPAMYPRLVFSYATPAARDADLTGLGPTDRAFVFVESQKALWRWNGSAWSLAAPWVQKGTLSLATDGTNQATAAVTFATAFTSAPYIKIQSQTGASTAATTWNTWATSVTTTGFTANAVRNNTTSMTLQWEAVLLP